MEFLIKSKYRVKKRLAKVEENVSSLMNVDYKEFLEFIKKRG